MKRSTPASYVLLLFLSSRNELPLRKTPSLLGVTIGGTPPPPPLPPTASGQVLPEMLGTGPLPMAPAIGVALGPPFGPLPLAQAEGPPGKFAPIALPG